MSPGDAGITLPSSKGNFGGGINYWAAKHVGFLLGFRDHVTRQEGYTGQLWNFRIGVAFRSKS